VRKPATRRRSACPAKNVSRPDQVSYYIAYCPADTTLDQLIRIAGSRWAIEECFQTAKQECGLDDYQVRRYDGWHATSPSPWPPTPATALRALHQPALGSLRQ
jgi:SRSO17 transposase